MLKLVRQFLNAAKEKRSNRAIEKRMREMAAEMDQETLAKLPNRITSTPFLTDDGTQLVQGVAHAIPNEPGLYRVSYSAGDIAESSPNVSAFQHVVSILGKHSQYEKTIPAELKGRLRAGHIQDDHVSNFSHLVHGLK